MVLGGLAVAEEAVSEQTRPEHIGGLFSSASLFGFHTVSSCFFLSHRKAGGVIFSINRKFVFELVQVSGLLGKWKVV